MCELFYDENNNGCFLSPLLIFHFPLVIETLQKVHTHGWESGFKVHTLKLITIKTVPTISLLLETNQTRFYDWWKFLWLKLPVINNQVSLHSYIYIYIKIQSFQNIHVCIFSILLTFNLRINYLKPFTFINCFMLNFTMMRQIFYIQITMSWYKPVFFWRWKCSIVLTLNDCLKYT